jgi:2'-5' RNA ligase
VEKASIDLAARGMTTFHTQGRLAHVTLYLTQYPASAAPALKAAVAKATKACRQFPLAATGLERTPPNWLFLEVDRTAALQRLADEVTGRSGPENAKLVPERRQWVDIGRRQVGLCRRSSTWAQRQIYRHT